MSSVTVNNSSTSLATDPSHTSMSGGSSKVGAPRVSQEGKGHHVVSISEFESEPKESPASSGHGLYIWSQLLNLVGIRRDFVRSKASLAEAKVAASRREFAALVEQDVLAKLQTSADGLTVEEAAARLKKDGKNLLSSAKPPRWYFVLLNAAANPFNFLLFLLAIVSVSTGDPVTMTYMLFMILLSTTIRFVQEWKSTVASTKLAQLVKTKVEVLRIRDGQSVEETIIAEDLVEGDIVIVTAGTMFAGDTRLLASKDLYLSQSSMTGEFLPVEKNAHPAATPADNKANVFDIPNLCLAGTNAVSGTAKGVVLATGDSVYMATIAANLAKAKPLNSFQVGVRRVSYLLIGFMLCMVPIVIVISGVIQHNFYQGFLFGISVAVGLTPEMLPMIVNANLARGALALAKKKAILKRMDAIQNLGAMDVLCSDKTGTLTKDAVVLTKYCRPDGVSDPQVVKFAYINSTFQTGLKNVLDYATIAHADENFRFSIADYRKVDELPFDFVRRRVSVIVEQNEKLMLITKGAVEEMLEICTSIQTADGVQELTEVLRHQARELVKEMNEEGLRVLAVASKPAFINPTNPDFSAADEHDLMLHGFIAFLDPPKDDVADVIARLDGYGVRVKCLTGDNLPVAKTICGRVGLDNSRCISGAELALLNDEEFAAAVEHYSVFGKLSPMQKFDVVQALKRNGHTVGFLGDGVNDALALKGSDVGISVETGTEIAKDAADVIMTEKNLSIIVDGVVCGRITHGNTIKYIKMAASSNFGNVFSVLYASAWLPFNPMTPLQVLTNNVLYDFSQTVIPFDNMDAEYIKEPHPWTAKGIATFMVFIGPTSSVFDFTTFAFFWWYLGIQTPDRAPHLQTGWFIESLLSQTLIVHLIRTRKIPFLQSTASWPVIVMSIVISAIGIAIPYSPIGQFLDGMDPPPSLFYLYLAGVLVCYPTLVQCMKMIYIRIFGEWL